MFHIESATVYDKNTIHATMLITVDQINATNFVVGEMRGKCAFELCFCNN